ncbi:MAG: hypothetical protein MHM6MM_000706 [Cercozoa sp. M6MM]
MEFPILKEDPRWHHLDGRFKRQRRKSIDTRQSTSEQVADALTQQLCSAWSADEYPRQFLAKCSDCDVYVCRSCKKCHADCPNGPHSRGFFVKGILCECRDCPRRGTIEEDEESVHSRTSEEEVIDLLRHLIPSNRSMIVSTHRNALVLPGYGDTAATKFDIVDPLQKTTLDFMRVLQDITALALRHWVYWHIDLVDYRVRIGGNGPMLRVSRAVMDAEARAARDVDASIQGDCMCTFDLSRLLHALSESKKLQPLLQNTRVSVGTRNNVTLQVIVARLEQGLRNDLAHQLHLKYMSQHRRPERVARSMREVEALLRALTQILPTPSPVLARVEPSKEAADRCVRRAIFGKVDSEGKCSEPSENEDSEREDSLDAVITSILGQQPPSKVSMASNTHTGHLGSLEHGDEFDEEELMLSDLIELEKGASFFERHRERERSPVHSPKASPPHTPSEVLEEAPELEFLPEDITASSLAPYIRMLNLIQQHFTEFRRHKMNVAALRQYREHVHPRRRRAPSPSHAPTPREAAPSTSYAEEIRYLDEYTHTRTLIEYLHLL